MNRLVSSHVPAEVAFRRVCAILMPVVLLGFLLTVGGIAVDFFVVRNFGLGLFLVAVSSLLAIVVLAHRCEHKS